MINQGFKQTWFSAFSDERLYSYFTAQNWKNMDKTTKEQLCQEVVNRDAKSMGMTSAPDVSFASGMDVNVLGTNGKKGITLNEDHFVNGVAFKNVKGELVEVKLPDSNVRALTTLFHENLHAFQDQIVRNEIAPPNKTAEIEYKANDFTVSTVNTGNGSVLGLHYLSGETPGEAGYYLYYLQSTERDAFRISEMKSAQIREFLAAKYGNESSFDHNRQVMKEKGFDVIHERAKQYFGNENIEKEINTVLVNQRYGTNYYVSREIDVLVKNEMQLSYLNAVSRQNSISATMQTNDSSAQQHDTGQIGMQNENSGTAFDASSVSSYLDSSQQGVAADSGGGGNDQNTGMASGYAGGIDI